LRQAACWRLPDNAPMQLTFTKMQGAGNDFVVLDETQGLLGLSPAQYRFLADRHFGVGADQILSVRPAPHPGVDFEYVIHNADGGQVENCGNGARCFVRYVHEQGLTQKRSVRVQVGLRQMALHLEPDGRVRVDMGSPVFDLEDIPFSADGLAVQIEGGWQRWPVELPLAGSADTVPLAVLSMGNPHAVCRVEDVDHAPVTDWGAWLESHPRFARRVNVGFLQVLDRGHARLRVFERGAGETLACGTGACAAVVAGIRLGWFDESVDVDLRGGRLTIAWPQSLQGLAASVQMLGPATTVFQGRIELPDLI